VADERKTLDDLTEVTSLQLTDVLLTKRPGGATSKTEVRDVLNLYKVADAVHAAGAKSAVDDADELPVADSGAAFALKKFTLANMITSIFKTARIIANAQFASATFKLFNAASTPRALTFNTAALTADRTLTLPDRNVDLGNLAGPTFVATANTTAAGAFQKQTGFASVTRISTGVYRYVLANPAPDLNYNFFFNLGPGNSTAVQGAKEDSAFSRTTTTFQILISNSATNTVFDSNHSVGVTL